MVKSVAALEEWRLCLPGWLRRPALVPNPTKTMSTNTDSKEEDAAENDDLVVVEESRLEEIESKLEIHESNTTEAIEERGREIAQLRAEKSRLRDEVEELRDEVETLRSDHREEIDRLDSRTDMLSLVQDSDEMDGRQRSITLLQHLHKQARRKADDSTDHDTARVSVNREESERALQWPDIDRTTFYSDWDRCVRLVDDKDVCWRGTDPNGESRLFLNLDAGDLPSTVTTRTE